MERVLLCVILVLLQLCCETVPVSLNSQFYVHKGRQTLLCEDIQHPKISLGPNATTFVWWFNCELKLKAIIVTDYLCLDANLYRICLYDDFNYCFADLCSNMLCIKSP